MIPIFLLILVLLAGSFLFNLAEMTFLTLDRAEYAALKQNNPRGAELISRVISSPARLFATLLLGIHASLTSANILTSHLLISLPLPARHREVILL
ncbi:MAG: CNNM domain-containing protein, partial [bacterium JZ-2024 1]